MTEQEGYPTRPEGLNGTLMRTHIQYRPEQQWLPTSLEAASLQATSRHALVARATDHSAALVFLVAENRIDVGSATCISVGHRYFLATAGHNFDDITRDDTIRIVSPTQSSDHWLPFVGRNTTRERGPGAVDVGWIELDPRTVHSTGLKFVDVRDLKPAKPTESGLYLVQGLPAQLASLTREKHRRSIRLTAVGCATESTRRMGQTHDLALRYGRAAFSRAGATVKLPLAYGLSGGGVWAVPRARSELPWQIERSHLVGIVRAWHRGDRRLSGVPIRCWLELLWADFPELRPSLDPVILRLR